MPPSSQPSLGCMTLSWRSPMLLRAFTKKPRKETSKRALKALTRLPPRIRMANSSLFSPPSQFFSRSSGVQSIETKCMTVGEAEEYELRKLGSRQNLFWGRKPLEYQIYSNNWFVCIAVSVWVQFQITIKLIFISLPVWLYETNQRTEPQEIIKFCRMGANQI